MGRFLAARFWRAASGFWRPPNASAARLITAVLIGSTVLQLALQYRLNYWSRDFFDAFGRRDGSALWMQALLFRNRPVSPAYLVMPRTGYPLVQAASR